MISQCEVGRWLCGGTKWSERKKLTEGKLLNLDLEPSPSQLRIALLSTSPTALQLQHYLLSPVPSPTVSAPPSESPRLPLPNAPSHRLHAHKVGKTQQKDLILVSTLSVWRLWGGSEELEEMPCQLCPPRTPQHFDQPCGKLGVQPYSRCTLYLDRA